MDGKALRRAIDGDDSVKYIVSAWAEGNGLVLGQMKVADKSNEITAVSRLLRVLELGKCLFAQAMSQSSTFYHVRKGVGKIHSRQCCERVSQGVMATIVLA